MSVQFDLEQQLLTTWRVTDDIRLMVERNAPTQEFDALATVYSHHFEKMWDLFEQLVAERHKERTRK